MALPVALFLLDWLVFLGPAFEMLLSLRVRWRVLFAYRLPITKRSDTPIFCALAMFSFHTTQWGAMRMVRSETTLMTPEARLYVFTSMGQVEDSISGGHWKAPMKVPMKLTKALLQISVQRVQNKKLRVPVGTKVCSQSSRMAILRNTTLRL